MQLDPLTCRQASLARDARFDGRFFVGVKSTGIYCRPICPARTPLERNVRYFPSAAAAAEAGLRPCLRCRPETAPGTPAWLGTSATVSRALRLIAGGALDGDGEVETLADTLGVTSRHLRRLFLEHVGATPKSVALTRRAHFAKRLIDETALPFADVAAASGYGSLRRFNGEMRRTYARTPTQLRASRRRPDAEIRTTYQFSPAEIGTWYEFRLAFRPPMDWEAVLAWLTGRATPGVESGEGGTYRRTITHEGTAGAVEVRLAKDGDALDAFVHLADPRALLSVVERIRRVFDLGAAPAVVAAHLGRDALLGARLRARPGLRVPGAWDGFELAVRAILGQQVSVRAATTLAGRVAHDFGEACDSAPGLTRIFPTAERLADAKLEKVGVIGTRAAAIRELARRVARRELILEPGAHASLDDAVACLRELPGVGAWTAHYVAMRALGEPDAFPSGDLVLRRAVGARTDRDLVHRAEAWRPWRAYAAMHLWQGATDDVHPLVHRDRQSRRQAAPRR